MLRLIITINIIILCSIFAKAQSVDKISADEFLGINSDSVSNEATFKNLRSSLHVLKKLKIKSYRLTISLDASGTIQNEETILPLIKKLQKKQIRPIPVIDFETVKAKFPSDYYLTNFSRGKGFCNKYSQYFNIAELGNNYDKRLSLADTALTDTENYNKVAGLQLLSSLQGFIDGVKSLDTTFKIAVSLSDEHYFWLALLEKYKIDYDVIAYHRNIKNEEFFSKKANPEVSLKLITEVYRKPVWVTEFHCATPSNVIINPKEFIYKNIKKFQADFLPGVFFITDINANDYYKNLQLEKVNKQHLKLTAYTVAK